MKLAIKQAKKCKPEDSRDHPLVGVVVVKDDNLLTKAYRGEKEPGDHAEFTALEKKLRQDALAGATVYTTLEPCTTRNHPKVPCAERLIERRVSRVVIGMLDPNQAITGKGIRRLREANIAVDLFLPALMAEVEELNRDFTRSQAHADISRHHDSQNAIYDAAGRALAKLVNEAELARKGRGRIIRHAHIQIDPPKVPAETTENARIQEFIRQFEDCIDRSGPGTWDVHQFYAVAQLARLDVIEHRVHLHQNARKWTVKVWPIRSIFPNFSPLIIGDEDAFLALDDPSSPHVGEGIHISGHQSVAVIANHFDSFFFASEAGGFPIFTVRNDQGLLEGQIAEIRRFMIQNNFPIS